MDELLQLFLAELLARLLAVRHDVERVEVGQSCTGDREQVLKAMIPRSVRVSEAPSYGQSVVAYDINSSGSLSYLEAAAEIAARGAKH